MAIVTIFYIILIPLCILWISSEVYLAIFNRSRKSAERSLDNASEKYIWISMGFANAFGVTLGVMGKGNILPFGFLEKYQVEMGFAGLVVITIGIIIRWWSIFTLKKFFTVNIAVSDEQTIVKSGLYRLIRHPSYTGTMLSFIGLGMAFANYLSVLGFLIPVTIAFINRIYWEEKALLDAFGDEYRDYSNHTWRLIPFLY